jgi:hypothetical protein
MDRGREDIDWEEIQEEILQKRLSPAKAKRKGERKSGNRLKPYYKHAYNTTKLEKLMAKRGEANANQLALQRGKVLLTKKRGDDQRAQVATAKTFDGIDVVDNYLAYDKNLVVEPQNPTLAAQFGNFQDHAVRTQVPNQPADIRTYAPCPI